MREIDANESPVELHKGEPVIMTNPQSFIICRLTENEVYLNEMIDKDDVLLTMSYVECEYVMSKPTGTCNASIGDKYLNKYNSNADVNDIYNENKSAAAMLATRQNMIDGVDPQDERATKPQPEPEQPSQQQPSQEEEKQEAKYLDDSFEESEWDGAPIGKCGDLVYKFTVNNST